MLAAGVAEIALGAAFVVLPRSRRLVGGMLAAFFVVIFPGNIAQYLEGTDAFGLDTDRKRLFRLFFQPVFVLWALFAETEAASGVSRTWTREPAATPSEPGRVCACFGSPPALPNRRDCDP